VWSPRTWFLIMFKWTPFVILLSLRSCFFCLKTHSCYWKVWNPIPSWGYGIVIYTYTTYFYMACKMAIYNYIHSMGWSNVLSFFDSKMWQCIVGKTHVIIFKKIKLHKIITFSHQINHHCDKVIVKIDFRLNIQ